MVITTNTIASPLTQRYDTEPSLIYEQLMSNLDDAKRLEIEQACQKVLKGREAMVEELAHTLKKTPLAKDGGFYHDIVGIAESEILYFALEGVKRGLISDVQFATLAFYAEANTGFAEPTDKLVAYSLFNSDGSVNEESKGILKRSVAFSHRLRDEEWDSFFNKMKMQQGASEQHFLLRPGVTAFGRDPQNAGRLTAHGVAVAVNLPFAHYMEAEDITHPQFFRLIPSCGMMQELCNARFGVEAVRITPAIGAFKGEKLLENNRLRRREIALAFPPHVALPGSADGNICAIPYEFSEHDFYHAYVASRLPRRIVEVLTNVGEKLLKVAKNCIEEKARYIHRLAMTYIDTDFPGLPQYEKDFKKCHLRHIVIQARKITERIHAVIESMNNAEDVREFQRRARKLIVESPPAKYNAYYASVSSLIDEEIYTPST